MSPLEQMQRDFAHAVIGVDAVENAAAPALASQTLGAVQGLSIYRNHYLITLEDALAATYAAIRSLVGERFFTQIARRFVSLSPPESPCLFAYGKAFPSYLDTLPEAARLPYLGDVARIEWAVNLAYHALDIPCRSVEANAPDTIAFAGNPSFLFHPATQLISSRFPVAAIWRAAHADDDPDLRVDLARGAESLLIFRASGEVVFLTLSDCEAHFMRALAEGFTVCDAAIEAGQPADRFSMLLESLIEAGAIFDRATPRGSTWE